MISKLKLYLTAAASFLAVLFYALWQGQKASNASDRADRATRTQRLQQRMTEALVEGRKKYKEKISRRVKPGRFT